MKIQTFNDERWPIGWRYGLHGLVMCYLLMAMSMIAIQYVKHGVAVIDERVAAINRDQDEALKNRDLPTLRDKNDKLQQQVKAMSDLRWVTLGAAAAAFVTLGYFIRATWQITQDPRSHWERTVRYLVLTPLILVPLSAFAGQNTGIKTVTLLVGVLIFTGQTVAVIKIAQLTNNQDLVRRINWTHSAMRYLLILLWLVASFATNRDIEKSLLVGGCWIVGISLTLAVAYHVMVIWQLRRRLI